MTNFCEDRYFSAFSKASQWIIRSGARLGSACLPLCLCLSLLFTGHAVASTIFQENFSGATPGGGPDAGGAYGIGTIPGTQITVTGGNVDLVGVVNGTNFACVDNPLGNCLDLIGNTGSGSISSLSGLNLIAGDTYTITFGMDAQGNVGNLEFSVGLGAFSQVVTAMPAPDPSETLTYTPSANQANAFLTFTSITNVDNVHGPVLDNIVVTQTGGLPPSSIPEPASIALLGIGFLGLIAFRYRRHIA